MNLIPISCLTQVSSIGILVFTLLSDVLTTVPFIIKGFELIAMGNKRTVVEESWFSGRKEDDQIVLETWAAECKLEGVKSRGWLFVIIGFSVLVVGVFTEAQAARLRRKWTKNGVLIVPPKRKMLLAMLGRNMREENLELSEPFFDPSDEAAAFQAQQQAHLVRTAGA